MSAIADGLGGKMIILITGASHAGKTLLAQKLLEKHKYPYFSIAQSFFYDYKSDTLLLVGHLEKYEE